MIRRLLTCLIVSLTLSLPSQAVETLRVLTWPGYADSDLVKAFEKKFDVRVEVSYISSDEVLRQKISANHGDDFDVFAANTAKLHHDQGEKFIVLLRLANIPHTANQLPRVRNAKNIPGITQLGRVEAVPCTYLEVGWMLDRKQFKKAPTLIAVM